MTDRIEFLLHAPDRATFVDVMTRLMLPNGKPLVTLEDGVLVPAFGVYIDEIGPIVRDDGATVAGHHVNCVAYGWMSQALTAGLPQTGTIFERTRILALLGRMDDAPEDDVPAGKVGTSGIRVFDPEAVDHRARVWA